MVLLNSLYRIVSESVTQDAHIYTIQLDPGNFIYKAHFPGQPVTPGVCIIQIARELLELHSGVHLQIATVKNVKFLHILSPVDNPLVTFSIQKVVREDNGIKCQVTVSDGDNVFAKLSFTCMA